MSPSAYTMSMNWHCSTAIKNYWRWDMWWGMSGLLQLTERCEQTLLQQVIILPEPLTLGPTLRPQAAVWIHWDIGSVDRQVAGALWVGVQLLTGCRGRDVRQPVRREEADSDHDDRRRQSHRTAHEQKVGTRHVAICHHTCLHIATTLSHQLLVPRVRRGTFGTRAFSEPDQQSGIHCSIVWGIQLSTPNNLGETWRRICSLDTWGDSALEVLRNRAL